MIFKNDKDVDVEVNQGNFKQILRGSVLGSGLTQVEFKDGKIEFLKASEEEIMRAVYPER